MYSDLIGDERGWVFSDSPTHDFERFVFVLLLRSVKKVINVYILKQILSKLIIEK